MLLCVIFFFLKRVNRVQTRHSVDREGLMSEFSEFEVGRHHRQPIETRRAEPPSS